MDVYVVDKLVPKGSDADTIKASVSTDKVPNRLVQPGAVSDLQDVSADKVAASDLQPGDQLVAARLVGEEPGGPEHSGQGPSVGAAHARASGRRHHRQGRHGRRVPQSSTRSTPTSRSPTPLRRRRPRAPRTWSSSRCWSPTCRRPTSRCSRTQTTRRASSRSPASEYIVTLALTPAQSERFVFATEFGHVWLSNEPATVSDDGTRSSPSATSTRW